MKKVLVLALCAVVIMTTVGCSEKNNKPESKEPNKIESNENTQKSIYFGKVKSIVGNEIELEIAENQEGNNNGENKEKGSVDELGPGASRDDVASDGGGGAGEKPAEGNGGNGSNTPLEDNKEKLELKYTGETKKIIIQSGGIILDLRSGNEAKVSSIKAGSVIRVYVASSDEPIGASYVEIVE